MPNDLGGSSWLATQYLTFLQGLESTKTGEAVRLSRSAQPPTVQIDPGKTPRISIPRWDDVVQLGPRTPVSKEEYQLHRHFEKAGLPSPLDPKLQQAIQDRRAIADRIRNSATPEYQQGISTMMTAVDNVQDSALTVAVGGKIGVAATGRFGQAIAPAVALLGKFAGLLNWLGLGLSWLGIGYALACQGPRDALSQARSTALAGLVFTGLRAVVPRARGIPSPIPTAGAKGARGIATFGVPSGREPDNHRASRWARAKPSFGELLQAAQATRDWVGYGLALGSIMGASAETAYASARSARGEKVEVRSPEVNHVFARVLSQRVAGLGSAALWHRWQCARALAAAPLILRDPEFWGETMYGLTWLTVYASLEPLMWDTDGLQWREPVINVVGNAAWSPWAPHDEITVGILEEMGITETELRWPVPGAPLQLDADTMLGQLGNDCARALDRFLEEDPNDPWRRLIAETAMNVTERVWYWLEGSNDFPRWKLSPFSAVFESLLLASRWPVMSDPPDKLMGAWAEAETYSRYHARQMLSVEVLDGIFDRWGIPLLRITGDGDTIPPEFFTPYDPETGGPGQTAFAPDLQTAREKLERLIDSERREGPS